MRSSKYHIMHQSKKDIVVEEQPKRQARAEWLEKNGDLEEVLDQELDTHDKVKCM